MTLKVVWPPPKPAQEDPKPTPPRVRYPKIRAAVLEDADRRDSRGMLMLISIGGTAKRIGVSEDRVERVIADLERERVLVRHSSGRAWVLSEGTR